MEPGSIHRESGFQGFESVWEMHTITATHAP